MGLALSGKPVNLGSAMMQKVIGTNISNTGEEIVIPNMTKLLYVTNEITDVTNEAGTAKNKIKSTSTAGTEDGNILVIFQ